MDRETLLVQQKTKDIQFAAGAMDGMALFGETTKLTIEFNSDQQLTGTIVANILTCVPETSLVSAGDGEVYIRMGLRDALR